MRVTDEDVTAAIRSFDGTYRKVDVRLPGKGSFDGNCRG